MYASLWVGAFIVLCVWVCACECLYLGIFECVYVCEWVCVCFYVFLCVVYSCCMRACVFVCICVCVRACARSRACVYILIYSCACMCPRLFLCLLVHLFSFHRSILLYSYMGSYVDKVVVGILCCIVGLNLIYSYMSWIVSQRTLSNLFNLTQII